MGLSIDLNVDLGEGCSWDAELMSLATSVNVGTGLYAGSPKLALETARAARSQGLAVGWHVGYPDPGGFGRRPFPWSQAEQILNGHLSWLKEHPADYLKLHGRLYHDATLPGPAADWLAHAADVTGLPILGLRGTTHEVPHHPFGAEGFADRGYGPDGRLLPRGFPQAELGPEEAAAQALRIAPDYDSLCVHGDREGCVETLQAVRRALEPIGLRSWV